MTTPVVTFDAVTAIIDQLPRDRLNPTNEDGTCLYTSDSDPTRHCIVGEIWARLGVPVPGPDASGVPAGACGDAREMHAPGVLSALGELQEIADSETWQGKPWAYAIDCWPEIAARCGWEAANHDA